MCLIPNLLGKRGIFCVPAGREKKGSRREGGWSGNREGKEERFENKEKPGRGRRRVSKSKGGEEQKRRGRETSLVTLFSGHPKEEQSSEGFRNFKVCFRL